MAAKSGGKEVTKTKKPYAKPVLQRQGLLAEVTRVVGVLSGFPIIR